MSKGGTMETGVYLRSMKDGKWQTLDLTEVPQDERDAFVMSLSMDGLLRLVNRLIDIIADIEGDAEE